MILEILETFSYEPKLGILPVVAAAAVGQLATGVYGMYQKNKEARNAQTLKSQLASLEKSRQEVFDASGDLRDLKNQVSNPYANLSVATQAAEIQAEQTDLALANTLDAVKAGGFGAGGATALAQAAARSKRGISASIEQQEVNNEKLRVGGEASVQAQKLQLEQAAIGAEGQAWQIQEQREMTQLDRKQAEIDQSNAQQAQYQADAIGAFTGALGTFSMGALNDPSNFAQVPDLVNPQYTGPSGGIPFGRGTQNQAGVNTFNTSLSGNANAGVNTFNTSLSGNNTGLNTFGITLSNP